MNALYLVVALFVVVLVIGAALWIRRSPTPATTRRGLLSGDKLSDDVWTDLENDLIAADVGPILSRTIVQAVRDGRPGSVDEARKALLRELVAILGDRDRTLQMTGSPAVIVVVGVNGSGKTTTIAKLAHRLAGNQVSVLLAAADTYRAAADTQLTEWGNRIRVPVVTGPPNSDPASVAFEAVSTARAEGLDVVIVDTAGRLHTQKNLMDELGKLMRVVEREAGNIDEVLLVLDGTTGQNGIVQAKTFTEAVGVTGIVITKLDGTSRGGFVIAVEQELGVPVKFVGSGEAVGDLSPFVPSEFAEAMLELS